MLFSSLEFLVLFLPPVLAVALRLRGQALLRWIVAASVVFYAFAGHWWFVIPMIVTTTIDYAVAIAIQREAQPRRRAWLLGLSLAIGVWCSPRDRACAYIACASCQVRAGTGAYDM